jgi:hypothetical protein
MIGAQDIRNQQCITGVVASSALSETSARTFHLVGRQNVELGVALIPEKINQNGMCRLQTDIAISSVNPQFLTDGLDLPETLLGMWDGDLG